MTARPSTRVDPIFRRRGWILAAFVSALCGALVAPQAAGAASKPAPVSGVWIKYSPDQSFVSAVLQEAAISADYTARIRAIIPVWRRQAAAGHDLALPNVSDRSPAGQLTAVNDLSAALDSQESGQFVRAVAANNPNTFPIRGQRDASGLYWTATFENDLAYCEGSCETTDRYVSRVRIDPGTTVTRVSATNRYFPDAGHLGNRHFEMWAVCRATVCGHANTGNLPTSSVDYLRDYGDRHSNVLTIGLTQWTYWNPLGTYHGDSGKTHDCDGEAAKVGNACRYSY